LRAFFRELSFCGVSRHSLVKCHLPRYLARAMIIEAPHGEGTERAEFPHLVAAAEVELNATAASLPPSLQEVLQRVVVLLQDFPTRAQVLEGVEQDQLGLFEGIGVEDPDSPQLPRITLWLGNLWELCRGDREAYLEEVRVTFLHELGHYLGLDEEDLIERDLG
jgi:predicted Zn-dependent protease with MMP-like domain